MISRFKFRLRNVLAATTQSEQTTLTTFLANTRTRTRGSVVFARAPDILGDLGAPLNMEPEREVAYHEEEPSPETASAASPSYKFDDQAIDIADGSPLALGLLAMLRVEASENDAT